MGFSKFVLRVFGLKSTIAATLWPMDFQSNSRNGVGGFRLQYWSIFLVVFHSRSLSGVLQFTPILRFEVCIKTKKKKQR